MLSLSLVGGAERSEEGARTAVQVSGSQARFSIGRDPACDWVLPDRTLALSARHCEIVRTAAGLVLRDLSTNGTFVNGSTTRLPGEHPLRDGDRIDAGPFTIAVALTADDGDEEIAIDLDLPTAPGVHLPAADATAELVLPLARGRDPAAVSLAALPPADDLGLTRIRPAPRPAAAAPAPQTPPARQTPLTPAVLQPPPAPQAAMSPPAAALPPRPPSGVVPAQAVSAFPADWVTAFAEGLGLPAEALAGRDPAQLALQVGRLARASIDGIRQLLDQQARARRQVGSRKQAVLRGASALSLAGDTDEALLALLASDPSAPLARAVADLARHQDQLLAAYRGAIQRLADDLAPATLAGSVPADDPARRWALYAGLWQRLGLTSDAEPWPAGFVEAALLHLAAVYDQDPAT